MSPLSQRVVILASLEGTYGTEAVPLPTTNAIPAVNVGFPAQQPEVHPRNQVNAFLSPFSHVVGARHATLEFSTLMHGAGIGTSLGTKADYDDLFAACGCTVTQAITTSCTIAPASSIDGVTLTSMTLYYYLDGILWKILGARGNAKMILNAGQPIEIVWTLTGRDGGVTDAALPTVGGLDAVQSPALLSAGFTLGGVSDVVHSGELDLGNTVAVHKDWNQASGIDAVRITGRVPTLTINPKVVLIATHSFYANMYAGTQEAVNIVSGSVAGNKATITAPKVQQMEGVNISDDDGLARNAVKLQLNRNTDATGDNEWTMKKE